MLDNRARTLNVALAKTGPVCYWMIRDQRVHDNWALLYAQEKAMELKMPLVVIFCLRKNLKAYHGTARLVDFMLDGLDEVKDELYIHNISFHFLLSDTTPDTEVIHFIQKNHIGNLITDFSPLKEQRSWKKAVAKQIDIPFYEVDTHNIVPCWLASSKQEFGAYTFRPKILKQLDSFLTDIPKLKKHPYHEEVIRSFQKKKMRSQITLDDTVAMPTIQSGEVAAKKTLAEFLNQRLPSYAQLRNDPNAGHTSQLSAYLHFGQISSQRIALAVRHLKKVNEKDRNAFLEELIVRKELSDNFCFYNSRYDSPDSFPQWAKKSLEEHKDDPREFTYTKKEFELAVTHDQLWNAAQLQMVQKGYMHGYMRMYWAKKILEWTENPEDAMKIAIFLNDKYQLDGRDPNGYAGIAWSIGGVHDRAWFERPIFGKIRYMNANGAKKKFDVQQYIKKWST